MMHWFPRVCILLLVVCGNVFPSLALRFGTDGYGGSLLKDTKIDALVSTTTSTTNATAVTKNNAVTCTDEEIEAWCPNAEWGCQGRNKNTQICKQGTLRSGNTTVCVTKQRVCLFVLGLKQGTCGACP
jgi:hypothetical protein